MQPRNLTPLIAILILLAIPGVEAQGRDPTQQCLAYEVANVGLVINAGTIRVCVYYPSEVEHINSVWNLGVTVTSPLITAVGTPVQTLTVTNSGCTAGTTQARTVLVGSFANTWVTPMTMTSDYCSGKIRAQVSTAGLVAVLDVELPFDVSVENQATYTFLCGATATTTNAADPDAATCSDPEFDTLARWCAASAFAAACSTPTANIDIIDDSTDDGMLTVPAATISNASLNATFPATLDVNARFPREPLTTGDSDWLHILAWIAAVLFFSYLGWLFALAFAVPGLLASLSPAISTMLSGLGLDFEALTILCLLGFILELAANRFSWGGYTSGGRRLTFTKTGA